MFFKAIANPRVGGSPFTSLSKLLYKDHDHRGKVSMTMLSCGDLERDARDGLEILTNRTRLYAPEMAAEIKHKHNLGQGKSELLFDVWLSSLIIAKDPTAITYDDLKPAVIKADQGDDMACVTIRFPATNGIPYHPPTLAETLNGILAGNDRSDLKFLPLAGAWDPTVAVTTLLLESQNLV